jgi:hypothetical protein
MRVYDFGCLPRQAETDEFADATYTCDMPIS